MNSWLAWTAFLLVALILTLVGYRFSLRALRFVTVFIAMSLAVYITWYGLTYTAKAAGGLSGAFGRGADALSTALFRAHPGQAGWVVIGALLVIGYRELEVWALHFQARSLDTSALAGNRRDQHYAARAEILVGIVERLEVRRRERAVPPEDAAERARC